MRVRNLARLAVAAGVAALAATTAAGAARSTDASVCEYRNVHLETESAVLAGTGTPALEALRQRFLVGVPRTAAGVGLRIVGRDEAWLRLQLSAFPSASGAVFLRVDLTPTLKLQHHHFIALMDDPEFESSGRLGASYVLEFDPAAGEWAEAHSVSAALRWIWDRTSPEIDALCDLRARLISEGWTELEELRKQLQLEIQRARQQRQRETQQKRLRLEVETGVE